MKAKRVDERIVRLAEEPTFTDTWHPIAHYKIIDVLEKEIKDIGIEIVKRWYSMSDDSHQMFGTWVLNEGNDSKWMMGFRNSTAMKFAYGLCAGNWVMNCSNMQFSGEWMDFRRHTSGLTIDTLVEFCKRVLKELIKRMKKVMEWHKSLKEISLTESKFKTLTFDAMKEGVFASSKFPKFLECIDLERKDNPDCGKTVYEFHGGVTRLLNQDSLFNIARKTSGLADLINKTFKSSLMLSTV